MTLDWKAYAFMSAVFAALTAVLGKIGVSDINSDLATFFRTVVILLFSAGFVSLRSEWQAPSGISSRGLVFIALSGVATGLSWLCYYRALQTGPASRVAPIDKLSVVLVVIFSVTVLGEHLNWKTSVGAILITTGAIFMAL